MLSFQSEDKINFNNPTDALRVQDFIRKWIKLVAES